MSFSVRDNPAQPDNAAAQYLTISLNQETYALDTQSVREIIEFGPLRSVPLMPPCVLGVLNLRGSVVPILDLRQRLGQGPTQLGRRSCIVILEVRREAWQQVIGVVVEAVNAVLEIAPRDIEAAPALGGLATDFIRGMGKLGNQLVLLLDVARLLSLDELQHLAQSAAGHAPAASA